MLRGLVTAIYAKNENSEVVLIEKNNVCGKKILATGNGRCNYWNEDQSIKHYRGADYSKIQEIVNDKNKNEIMNFFNKIGIVPKIKNGYYYPFSNQAISMQKALVTEAQRRNVQILTNKEVIAVNKTNNKFQVKIKDAKDIIADYVVISTGSKASTKTGSDGIGYEICKKFNHTINKPLPALVQLKANEKYLKQWEGVRADVLVRLLENEKEIACEKGEIQLTNYGISGICVFNVSGRVSKGIDQNKKEEVVINFLDSLNLKSPEEFIQWMNNRDKLVKNRNIMESLECILNYKLVNIFLELSNIELSAKWSELNENQKKILANKIINFKLKITGTNSFDKAQVCTGGVPLTEIDTKTMQSKKIKGLYIVGEILDVDGDCGGYNLEWAWLTGMIAGTNI